MNYTNLEIIIPVYNEGEKILRLLNELNNYVKTNFKVLICYDLENDDLFNFKNDFKKFNFDINLIITKKI